MNFHVVPILLSLTLLSADLSAQDSLRKDEKGRYRYEHTSYAPGASKAVLYERMKPFILNELNASDTRISWDEVGQDSVHTIAYIELGTAPLLENQLVDCRAKLVYREEQVTLFLTDFNFQAKMIGSDTAFGRPLHRMSPIPFSAQSYALTALSETLRQLMDRMDLVAVGRGAERDRPAAARSRTRR